MSLPTEEPIMQANELIQRELARYDSLKNNFDALGRILTGYIESTITEWRPTSLPLLHSVTYRVKERKSLERKLEARLKGKGDEYPVEIDDTCGVRVIFYFRDDMDDFLRRFDFQHSFGTSTRNSLDDKVKSYKDNEFGYRSVHFTVRVTPNTNFYDGLRSYDRIRLIGLPCEVQVRTILEHAWAETAHDIIYKPRNTDFPRNSSDGYDAQETRRSWHAMSATLELLDGLLVNNKPRFIRSPASNQSTPERLALPSWAKETDLFHYLGQTLPYILLHRGDLEEIGFEEDWRLFNVDRAIGKGFKDAIWEQLTEIDRSYVDIHTYDSTTVRVMRWSDSEKKLFVQPATYSDQVVTNHKNAHECIFESRGIVFDLAFDQQGDLQPFHLSPLANSIGVSCVVRTHDEYWMIGRRIETLSVFSGKWSCPVSGAMEWRPRGLKSFHSFKEWVEASIRNMCAHELGLELDPRCLRYLGFTRELRRLGKPQFFFLIDLGKDLRSSVSVLSTYMAYSVEHQFSKLQAVSTNDIRKLVSANWDDVLEITDKEDVSEELIMNLALALEFLSADER
jgi:ppGpp synthetase/RelA/SpoT-type nucleotidyltranferase